jgi:dolichyl-phosphate-mannose-protein mannosyltransferase
VAEGAGVALAFILVPAAVYLASWIPWLGDNGWSMGAWFRHHLAMADYHLTLETITDEGEPIHPYLSPAWSWFLLARPVAYFWRGDPRCCAEIMGIGNPLLFWGALLVVPYLAWAWWSNRDWRCGAALVPLLAQYLPWLLVTRPLFLFYMTPVTPFLALGTAYAVRDLGRRMPNRRVAAALAAAVVVVAVAAFAFFWPVLVGRTLSLESWGRRIWFQSPGLFNWV